jgi:hypothetical protein
MEVMASGTLLSMVFKVCHATQKLFQRLAHRNTNKYTHIYSSLLFKAEHVLIYPLKLPCRDICNFPTNIFSSSFRGLRL